MHDLKYKIYFYTEGEFLEIFRRAGGGFSLAAVEPRSICGGTPNVTNP